MLKTVARGLSWRHVAVLALLITSGASRSLNRVEAQSAGCTSNPVACENANPGTPGWDVTAAGDPTIQGFATEFSVDHGNTVHFKISTPATSYRIEIFRMGYYGGIGARRVATVQPSVVLPQAQPNCLTDSSTGLIDCGNWQESAAWLVPPDATSGIYFAKLTRLDRVSTTGSHIYFVVRADEARSALVLQTSDTTWQAYNSYGGNSLYIRSSPLGRALKVSYNRPFNNLATDPRNAPFYSEYPMVRWLEANGYDVSYIAGADTDRSGATLLNHKAFLSVGHDEYWSARQRANVEAARAAGVHLAFFSGNEVFWKTRWEPSIDTTQTPYRTLVSYKETKGDAVDPTSAWTGTWRDPRFSPPKDGGRPENSLTGQLFTVNRGTAAIMVPSAFSRLRFWRHTTIAALTDGQTATLGAETLGYEWDEDVDNGFRPAGLMHLSSTTVAVPEHLVDYGNTYAPATATHTLTLYRHSSGALVFGAGTVQWTWGLDPVHDLAPVGASADLRMQQATVNLFMDMGVVPATPASGLDTTPTSIDQTRPVTTIISPVPDAEVKPNGIVVISGTASDSGGVVAAVDVSVDGGTTWHPATLGADSWTYSWSPTQIGTVTLAARAVDDSGNVETPGASVVINVIDPQCPCTLWSPAAVPAVVDALDSSAVELGVKFRAGLSGYITGVRFYKSAANTGVHTGTLWSSSGTLLASATFAAESSSGWQQVNFAVPVAVTANTTYVASYHTNTGRYSANGSYFASAGLDTPPLHALAATTSPNGVYRYGPSAFPASSYQGSNYWVDVVFDTSLPADATPPTVTGTTPAPGGTNIATTAKVQVTFSEPMDPATLTSATFELTDAAGAPVSGALAYDPVARTLTLTPGAPLAYTTAYTVRVRGGSTDPRVKDLAGNALVADVTWTFTTAGPAACPCSLWNPGLTAPQQVDSGDPGAVELGVKFRSEISGFVAGVRFYKSAMNTGAHVGNLWSSNGTLLARATFTNETANGWQEVLFATPVNVTANTTYIVSYHTNTGHYAADTGFFAAAVDTPPLSAPASASDPNGVYRYGATTSFPSSSYSATNYWVDVVFTTIVGGGDLTPPVVMGVTPAAGASDIDPSTTVTVNFSEPMLASTITTSTIELRDPNNVLVPGTVTYDSLTRNATFAAAGPLAGSSTYQVVVKGGSTSPRVTDLAGNPLAATFTSTFTTAAPAACPCSLWRPDVVPGLVDAGDDGSSVELGVKFRADLDGLITALRFYKSAANTGTHLANLWTLSGTLLGTATFTGETASGWQEALFAAPIPISANTTYIASYHTDRGHYAATGQYFAAGGAGIAPLHAPANTVETNGVYRYGASGFPTSSYNASNYWVDVVFTTSTVTPPPTSFVDTRVTDFSRGSLTTSGYISQSGDGEVMLAPLAATEFNGTTLPAGWSSASWGGASSATVAGGVLSVDGARVATDALFGPGRSLEFAATFSGNPYQHVGFGLTFNETPWAIFSSGPGDGLYVRTNNGANALDTRIPGSWFGTRHTFRIDWAAGGITYSIDGTPVAVHSAPIAASMRPIASDYNADGTPLRVEWLHLSPYASTSTFVSAVFDASTTVSWSTAVWRGTAPLGTAVTLSVRYGDTPVPDANWTAFTAVKDGSLAGKGRYAQYRLDLTTSDASQTPVVTDVTLTFAAQ